MSALTDTERDILLATCTCSHTINDHGTLVACWPCSDEGNDCPTNFEALLAARVETIVQRRITQPEPVLIDGRPKQPLGAAPWLAKPVCECCGSTDRAEVVHDRVLCPTCAEEEP